MSIALYKFLDISEGLQEDQFKIGSRGTIESLEDLNPIYKRLLDDPVTGIFSVIAPDGRPSLTPMWFDYHGDKVLVNVAGQRGKTSWIRDNPEISLILVNPENPYHWVSMKITVENELHEDAEGGSFAAEHVNKISQKYNTNNADYSLRDPGGNERRVLFTCRVDKVSTFGKP
jgi:PPOX class probable F420-dependent enzyme